MRLACPLCVRVYETVVLAQWVMSLQFKPESEKKKTISVEQVLTVFFVSNELHYGDMVF